MTFIYLNSVLISEYLQIQVVEIMMQPRYVDEIRHQHLISSNQVPWSPLATCGYPLDQTAPKGMFSSIEFEWPEFLRVNHPKGPTTKPFN
jgi:hypothetical protein